MSPSAKVRTGTRATYTPKRTHTHSSTQQGSHQRCRRRFARARHNRCPGPGPKPPPPPPGPQAFVVARRALNTARERLPRPAPPRAVLHPPSREACCRRKSNRPDGSRTPPPACLSSPPRPTPRAHRCIASSHLERASLHPRNAPSQTPFPPKKRHAIPVIPSLFLPHHPLPPHLTPYRLPPTTPPPTQTETHRRGPEEGGRPRCQPGGAAQEGHRDVQAANKPSAPANSLGIIRSESAELNHVSGAINAALFLTVLTGITPTVECRKKRSDASSST